MAPAYGEEPLQVGVLALQGDFAAHQCALQRAGAWVTQVRSPRELEALDALVIPGGESTTLIKLIHELDLWESIRDFAGGGKALLGTCAGLILLAAEVRSPQQDSLALLPITVERNAYGRQVDSFVSPGAVWVPPDLREILSGMLPGGESFGTEFVFIRAPRIVEMGEGVEILARHDEAPVLVRRGAILGASFHPELGGDGRVEALFLAMAYWARSGRLSGR